MTITFEGSKSEIIDFILLLQNRRIARVPYTDEYKYITISPEDLVRDTNKSSEPVVLTDIDK